MSLRFCLAQEVGKQLVPRFCEHTLWMELHSLQMGVVAMAEPHDRAVFQPSGDLQALREGGSFRNQAVISRSGEGLGKSSEDAFTAMLHGRRFPMH